MWVVRLSLSSMVSIRFLAEDEGVTIADPRVIERLWEMEGLAGMMRSSVLARHKYTHTHVASLQSNTSMMSPTLLVSLSLSHTFTSHTPHTLYTPPIHLTTLAHKIFPFNPLIHEFSRSIFILGGAIQCATPLTPLCVFACACVCPCACAITAMGERQQCWL